MANLPHGATAHPKTCRQPARLIPQLQTPRIPCEAERVHRLGVRVLGELSFEIVPGPPGVAAVLAAIKPAVSLTPDQIQAAGADQLAVIGLRMMP